MKRVVVVAVALVAALAGMAAGMGPGHVSGALAGVGAADVDGLVAVDLSPSADGWVLQDPPPALMAGPVPCRNIVSIWGSSPTNVFGLASCGALIRYDGSGWSLHDAGPLAGIDPEEMPYVSDMWGSSPSDLFVLGGVAWWEHCVFHYDGTGWTTSTITGHDGSYSGIWGMSASDLFVAGTCDMGTVAHFDGSSWSEYWHTSDGMNSALHDVWGSSSCDVFAAGYLWGWGDDDTYFQSGMILHYDGSTWVPMDIGSTADLYAVWGVSSSSVFAAGEDGTIIHYNGSVWSPMNSGTVNDLNAVWGTSGADVYAAGRCGALVHYDGSSWSPVDSGTANDLNAMWGSSACDVFAVGDSGTILHHSCPCVIPTAPMLSAPADGVNVPGTSVTFRWNASTGATKYFLVVSTNPSLSATVSNASVRKYWGQVSGTQRTVSGFRNNGTSYFWWVYAGNSCGWCGQDQVSGAGGWRVVNGVTPGVPAAPTLVSPADGANIPGTSVTFRWSASAGATKYFLVVSTNPSLSVTVSNASVRKFWGQVNATQRSVAGFRNDGTIYYWWVYAGNSYGWCGQAQVAANGGWSLSNGY